MLRYSNLVHPLLGAGLIAQEHVQLLREVIAVVSPGFCTRSPDLCPTTKAWRLKLATETP